MVKNAVNKHPKAVNNITFLLSFFSSGLINSLICIYHTTIVKRAKIPINKLITSEILLLRLVSYFNINKEIKVGLEGNLAVGTKLLLLF